MTVTARPPLSSAVPFRGADLLTRTARGWARDLVWFLPLVAAGIVTLVAGRVAPGWVDVALLLLGPAPVLWRRTRPRAALLSAVTLLVGAAVLGRDSSVMVTTLAVVIVTAVADDARLPALAVFVLSTGAVDTATVLDARRLGTALQPSALIFGTFGTGLAIGLGVLLRRHRQALSELAARNAELAERNAELDRLRVAEAHRAVADERTRIARELHDVVAHHVAGIAVRAGAAAHVHARRPDYAAETLAYVARAGTETLTAMRRLVAVLRDDAEPDASAEHTGVASPQPTLDQLPALLDRQRAAGQQVQLTVTGAAVPLPADVQLALYRVVQEALTNALRHAAGAPVRVALRWRATDLSLSVVNSLSEVHGVRPPGRTPGGGHGLLGMRERVELCGGELSAGPTASGWRVEAQVPCRPAAPAEPAW